MSPRATDLTYSSLLTDEPSEAPDSEPLTADCSQSLTLDVDVRDQTPADAEERVHRLQQVIANCSNVEPLLFITKFKT